MKYARSQYLAGEIVSAVLVQESEEDPYRYSRKYGLVCPCCQEAVFWRRDHRRGNAIIPASFCHYNGGSDPNCELRSERLDGEAYKRQLNDEARKQRLDLYNKYLWEIIQSSEVRHNLGDRQIKALAETILPNVRKALQNNRDFWLTEVEIVMQDFCENSFARKQFSKFFTQECIAKDKLFLSKLDKELHCKIVREVLEFLATRTGGFVLAKLCQASLVTAAAAIALQKNTVIKSSEASKVLLIYPLILKDYDFLIRAAITNLFQVDWCEQFKKLSEDRERYA